jgi:Family of unknown function (DUF6191)
MTQWGIDTLFNPGKRHMDEEKRRLQSTREEVGDSSGGKRIDLDGGKVRLAGRPDKNPTDTDSSDQDATEQDPTGQDATEQDPTDEVTDQDGESPQADTEPAEAEDTPAARARRRRRSV